MTNDDQKRTVAREAVDCLDGDDLDLAQQLVSRILMGRTGYEPFDLAGDTREFIKEAKEENFDQIVYLMAKREQLRRSIIEGNSPSEGAALLFVLDDLMAGTMEMSRKLSNAKRLFEQYQVVDDSGARVDIRGDEFERTIAERSDD